MKIQYAVLIGMILSAQAVSVHAAPPTPAQQAFTDAQTLANGAVAGAATGVTNGTVQSTVNSFKPTYYSYSNTAPETALFMGGNGDTFTAGTAKITACQTGAANPDAFRQQNCDAINFMAKNPSTRPQFTISPTDPNIAASRAIEKNASTLAAKSLGFIDPNAVGSFTGCASKTTTTPPTFGIEVCYDATTATSQMCTIGRTVVVNANTDYQCDKTTNMYQTQTCTKTLNATVTQAPSVPATTVLNCPADSVMKGNQCQSAAMAASVNYSCSNGSALNGTTCQPAPTTATLSYSCVSGTLSGTSCVQPAISATTTYSCPAGGTLSGTTCQAAAVNATVAYSCSADSTLSGTSCLAPAYQPAGVAAVGVPGWSQYYIYNGIWNAMGYGPFTAYPPLNSLCNLLYGNSFAIIFGGYAWCAKRYATTAYSCPSGYTQSGSTCYPPMVTPPPTAATASYSCPATYTLSGTTCIAQNTAATPTTSCPINYSLSGSGCITPATPATASYSCPVGSLSGTSCYPPPVGATVSYTCSAGNTLSGTTCTPPATTPLVTYSCGTGTRLSGSSCISNSVISTTWTNGCATQEAAAL